MAERAEATPTRMPIDEWLSRPATSGPLARGAASRPRAPDVGAAAWGALRAEPRAMPSRAAMEMLWRLPAGMLTSTAALFPHVLDAIAEAWSDPTRFHAAIDALVFDARGGRAGFPPQVLAELSELRHRYESWVGPRATRGR